MNFTPKIKVRQLASGFLTTAMLGLTPWVGYAASMPVSNAIEQFTRVNGQYTEAVFSPPSQMVQSDLYQPVVSWQKSKHWLKRNAPILGGAGGGALLGGVVGGGTGAVVGGALGAGGGYLYKRHREHDRHEYHSHNYNYYQHHH